MKFDKYKRKIHPFLNRLVTIWEILTVKEYILVKIDKRENKCRYISIRHRTNGDDNDDLLTLYAAVKYSETKK